MSASEESIGETVVRPGAPGVREWTDVVKLIADALPDAYRVSGGGAKGTVLKLTIVRKEAEHGKSQEA